MKMCANKANLYWLLLSIFSLLGAGCEDVIDLELDVRDPQFTVDAVLTNEAKPQVIKLSSSVLFFDNSGNYPPVTVDSVVVTDQDNRKFFFEPASNQPGSYVYTPSVTDTFAVGSVYKLHIYTPNTTYSAVSEMRRSTPIDSISISESNANPGNFFVFLNAIDQPGPGDRYWIRTFRNDTLLIEPSDINIAWDAATGPGGESDGQAFIFPIAFLPLNNFQRPYKLGEQVRVEILGITPDFYQFLLDARTQTSNQGIFAAPPANVRTNIHSSNPDAPKPVGFFNVCQQFELSVVIEDD